MNLKCEWCGREFGEGQQYHVIFKHMVDCMNDMFRVFREMATKLKENKT